MKKFIYAFLIVIFCFQGTTLAEEERDARDYEHPTSFHITHIFVSHETNMHFRVMSDQGPQWHCHGGPQAPAWSYINRADDGAETKIATLMTAYSLNHPVSLTTIGVDIDGKRYCRIEEIHMFRP